MVELIGVFRETLTSEEFSKLRIDFFSVNTVDAVLYASAVLKLLWLVIASAIRKLFNIKYLFMDFSSSPLSPYYGGAIPRTSQNASHNRPILWRFLNLWMLLSNCAP